MNAQEMKQAALLYIEDHKDELIHIGKKLYAMPETGFREEKTAAYVKSKLEECGLSVRDHVAYTGIKACAFGRKHQINLAVMGELDALLMPGHPDADPVTGAFHGCGHHAQLTVLIGVALGLVQSGLIKELDGDLSFIGVPAEEVIEAEYRKELIRQGKIHFASGKQEMISLGEFDDVDMILCSHIMGKSENPHAWVGHSWNGKIGKVIRFHGLASHAGLAPERGVNALEAAISGLVTINGMRSAFSEKDHVRIHYIITKGGDSANVVPDDVRIEMGVRAATVKTFSEVSRRVDAALRSAAASVGATVEILNDCPYLPCHQSVELGEIYLANATELLGSENVDNSFGEHRGSSTDCGNVSSLLPIIHPYFGGAIGAPHGADFEIVNDYAAYVVPAKIAAMTIIDLLSNDAILAKKVKANYQPVYASKEDYLQHGALRD